MLLTSYSHRHAAAGARPVSGPTVLEGPCREPLTPCADEGVLWFNRSQTRTKESSAPDASMPLRDGHHSIELRGAACPRSSRRACPGCRTSRIRMMFESCAKVPRR